MGSNTARPKDLGDYLHRRLSFLETLNAEMESNIGNQKAALTMRLPREKSKNGVYDKSDASIVKIINHLDFVLLNTSRYTILIAVCSFLEEAMKEISKQLVLKYEKELASQASTMKRANWLKKHVELLIRHAGIDANAVQSDLSMFHDLICLRNCVVHCWGKVDKARNPQAVHAASNRIDTAEVSRDGYLIFGDQVIPEAIIAAENIAESILTSKLGTSMT